MDMFTAVALTWFFISQFITTPMVSVERPEQCITQECFDVFK
jgi:Trk-type K+ transport system membrane component